MMTNWMHASDTWHQLFLARMLVLAGAIGMGVVVFGLGAVVVRGLAAARLWLGQRTPGGSGVRRYQRAVN